MAKKKNTNKTRYRKGGPARLDMRKGGRVALQDGGPGNIREPDIDRQLTPEEIEDMIGRGSSEGGGSSQGGGSQYDVGYIDPTTGQVWDGQQFNFPQGITAETHDFINGVWTAKVVGTGDGPQQGDVRESDGFVYNSTTGEYERPSTVGPDDTWDGANWIPPVSNATGVITWELSADGNFEFESLDGVATGNRKPTAEYLEEQQAKGFTWNTDLNDWNAYSPTDADIEAQKIAGYGWDAEKNDWVPITEETRDIAVYQESEAARVARAERIRKTGELIKAAGQGKIIDDDGNVIDMKIADPKKAGGYQKDENGDFVLDADGNPIPIVAEQDIEAGRIPEFDAEGNRIIPQVTAAQAGGFETDAQGNIIRDAEGNPIPKITGETVETIEDKDIETALATGYQRNADGTLKVGEDGKPIPITADTYTADAITAAEAAEAKATAATGAILDDSKALAKELTAPALTAKAEGKGATLDDQEVIQAYQERVVGVLNDAATIENFQKVAGTDLPRVLRAKKQLRKAGLSEEDINTFANDPDALEDKLLEYTEAERGMVEGLPNEALVNVQLDALLSGMDSGEIPAFARPAVAAVNEMMAQRGLDVSTVGRTQLFNAIISAALPIAQSNAQAIKESVTQQRGIEAQAEIQNAQMAQQSALNSADKIYNLDMAQFSADQNQKIANSKFLQTVTMTEASNVQQTIMQDAVAMSQLDLATLDANTKLRAQNAQAFLQMDLTNLTNEQQANVLNAQQSQQRLLSNQAATNAAAQFNSASQNQTNQFMANLAAQTDQFNVAQGNAMVQFNATQTNAAEARRTAREADLAKFNSQLVTQTDQFNAQQEFARTQWNAQNAAAVEQSNTQWRRQINLADTAAQNAVNMQNSQNAFQLSSQSMAMMWQELRDQADFDFRAAENIENRKTQIISTALANEGKAGERYDDFLTSLLSSVTNSFTAGYGTSGTSYGGAGGGGGDR
jgi:hypothetical protein